MNLDLIFHNSDISDFGKTRVQHLIYKNLVNLYDYNFNVIHPYTLDIKMAENPANLKSMLMFTIANNENKKAILVNLADRLEPNLLPNHGFDSFDIAQIIGGMSIDKHEYQKYKEVLDNKRKPLMIPVDKVSEDDYLFNYKKPVQDKIKKALFIGNVYSGRTEIVDILKKHPLFDIRHYIREVGYPFSEYINEMQKYSMCLSLNGFAEICYRDIEAMAIQVPILRSRFLNDYHNELIADYHYIAGSEPCENGFLRYSKLAKEIADQFIDKIESVIDNEEYLNNIALNGRQYYENNCTIKSIADNATKLINLDLLK
jgi:hypothetical protein